jgi:hypothetical protein
MKPACIPPNDHALALQMQQDAAKAMAPPAEAPADAKVHSLLIVNAALAARGERPLPMTADGRAVGLLAAAARLGLDNATPYLRCTAAAAGAAARR